MVFKAIYIAVSICAALIIGTIAVTAVSNSSDSTDVSRGVIQAPATYRGPTDATAAELAPAYFLVDSEAQRTTVFVEVEAGDWNLPSNQAGEHNFLVLLAGTAEDDARALAFLGNEESRLKAAGIAELRVIDLRNR